MMATEMKTRREFVPHEQEIDWVTVIIGGGSVLLLWATVFVVIWFVIARIWEWVT